MSPEAVLRLLSRRSPRSWSWHCWMKVSRLCLPVGELLHYRRRCGKNPEEHERCEEEHGAGCVLLVAAVEASIVREVSPLEETLLASLLLVGTLLVLLLQVDGCGVCAGGRM